MVEVQVAENHGSVLFDILTAAAMRDRDSREDVRYPLIRPVVVHVGDQNIKALTREISRSGIGLTHKAPLPRGECHLTAALEDGQLARIPISVRWCQQLDDEWCISGAMFLIDDAAERLTQADTAG
jgi:hypothetical protein